MQDVKKFEDEMQDCERSPGSMKIVIFIDIFWYGKQNVRQSKLELKLMAWISEIGTTFLNSNYSESRWRIPQSLVLDVPTHYKTFYHTNFFAGHPPQPWKILRSSPPQFCIAGEILINVLVKAKLWRLQASSSANWRSIAGPATLFQNLNFQGKVCCNALASESVVVSSRKSIVLL